MPRRLSPCGPQHSAPADGVLVCVLSAWLACAGLAVRASAASLTKPGDEKPANWLTLAQAEGLTQANPPARVQPDLGPARSEPAAQHAEPKPADLARTTQQAERENSRPGTQEVRGQPNGSEQLLTISNLIQWITAGVVSGLATFAFVERYYKLKLEAVQAKSESQIAQIQVEKNLEKNQLHLDKNKFNQEMLVKEREWSIEQDKQRKIMDSYAEFAERTGKSRTSILNWLRSVQERLTTHTKHLKDAVQRGDNTYVEWFEHYVTGEVQQMEEIAKLLHLSAGESHTITEAIKEALAALDKFSVSVRVIYDGNFEPLASQITENLRGERYRVADPINWLDFREPEDGAMSRFFKDGPVLWYQSEDNVTSRGADQLARSLARVLPETMTIRHGREVRVPGTTWHIGPRAVQIWLFRKPDPTNKSA